MDSAKKHFFQKILTIFNITVLLVIVANFSVNKLLHNNWPPALMKNAGLYIFKFRANLSDEQVKNISESRENFLESIAVLNNEASIEKEKLVELLASAETSPELIEKSRSSLHRKQEELQKRVIKQILDVKRELTPEQQQLFGKMIKSGIQSNTMHPINRNF